MEVIIQKWSHWISRNDWGIALLPAIDVSHEKGETITLYTKHYSIILYWLIWSMEVRFDFDKLKEKKYESKD